MNPELLIVLALLVGAMLMFSLGRPRADAVGLLIVQSDMRTFHAVFGLGDLTEPGGDAV